jgi:RNA 2',3'-cyclic 3'-phosphodiesterase
VRLFVAIVPPPSVTAALDARLATLRAAWPGLRWTGPESWHLTLAFLGEVRGEVLPGLSERLSRAAHRHPARDLGISGAGAFPGPARARVLWAGIDGDQAALRALAASVAAGARRAGAPPPDEGRRFRPHITLARLRAPLDVRPLTAALTDLAGCQWTAARIELIRSHQPRPEPGDRDKAGRAPRYESLAAWPLRQPAGRED